MPESRPNYVIDADSYWNYLNANYDPRPSSLWNLNEENEAPSILYLVLRNIGIVCHPASKQTIKQHTDWTRFCRDRALFLGVLTQFTAEPPLPTWAEAAVQQVRDQLRPIYPQVDQIEVLVTFDSRLYVRSYHALRQIRVSLVTREILRTVNLLIWNHIGAAEYPTNRRMVEYSYDTFMPFLLPLYWKVPWNQVPMLRAMSADAAEGAQLSTRLQMTFMIAHEFAHLLLHDDRRVGPELEAEADRFAYDVLFRAPGSHATVGDIWMSTRWLHEILAIERAISWRLSGSDGTPPARGPRRETLLYPFARSAGPSFLDVTLGGRGLRLLVGLRNQIEAVTAVAGREAATQWADRIRASGNAGRASANVENARHREVGMKTVNLELEIDPLVPGVPGRQLIEAVDHSDDPKDVTIRIVEVEDGHGFGVSEVITIVVVIGAGVASDLVASTIKAATRGVIRRVRAGNRRSDGSAEGLTGLIDEERRTSAQAEEHDNGGGAAQ